MQVTSHVLPNQVASDLLSMQTIADNNGCNIDFKDLDKLLYEEFGQFECLEDCCEECCIVGAIEQDDDFSDYEKKLEQLSFENKPKDYDFTEQYLLTIRGNRG